MASEVHSEERELDRKLHPIDPNDPYVRFVLCYPREKCSDLDDRVLELREWGVSHLVEEGKNMLGFLVVGKGYSSITTLAMRDGVRGVLKIRRLDSRRNSLELEGLMLDFLDRFGIVPRPMFYSKNYVFMEYLNDCTPLVDYLRRHGQEGFENRSIVLVMRKILYSLYIPDFYRIDHTELNRAEDHMYLCKDNVKIIDWESATIRSRPSNVTSFVSYLLNRTVFKKALSPDRRRDLILILKTYKETYSIKKLEELVKLLAEPLRYSSQQ